RRVHRRRHSHDARAGWCDRPGALEAVLEYRCIPSTLHRTPGMEEDTRSVLRACRSRVAHLRTEETALEMTLSRVRRGRPSKRSGQADHTPPQRATQLER